MNASPLSAQLVFRAARQITAATGIENHDVVVVLGSGWSSAVQQFGTPLAVVPVNELTGFHIPSAVGHQATATSCIVDDHHVLVFTGRIHLYEGYSPAQIVHPVRTGIAAGAKTVILTNAAGSLNPDFSIGQPVLISDHLNFTGRSPLIGSHFVNLVDAYCPDLRLTARHVDPDLAEGVYAMMPGPQYETPAEISMLRTLGADLVGMSTVLETIAARAEGVQVLGLSLVTNAAAGITGQAINHQDVLEIGLKSGDRIGSLVKKVIACL